MITRRLRRGSFPESSAIVWVLELIVFAAFLFAGVGFAALLLIWAGAAIVNCLRERRHRERLRGWLVVAIFSAAAGTLRYFSGSHAATAASHVLVIAGIAATLILTTERGLAAISVVRRRLSR